MQREAKFKEFKSQLKFKMRLKFCCFHLNLYYIFQASVQLKPVFGSFETRLKFTGHCCKPWIFQILILNNLEVEIPKVCNIRLHM